MPQGKVFQVKATKFKNGVHIQFSRGDFNQSPMLELLVEVYSLSKLYHDSVMTTKTFLTTRIKIWNIFRRTEQLEAQLWFRLRVIYSNQEVATRSCSGHVWSSHGSASFITVLCCSGFSKDDLNLYLISLKYVNSVFQKSLF
jgi:hypothetical protein